MSPESLWEHCLAALESELPAQQFATWIRPLRVDAQVADALCLIAPNRFVLDWVNNHYLAHIENLAREAQPQASHCLSTRLMSAAPAGGRRPTRPTRRIVPRRAAASTEFDNDYKSPAPASVSSSRVPQAADVAEALAPPPAKKRKPTPEVGKRRTPPTSALEILSGERALPPKQTQLALGDELSLDTPETEDLGQGMPFEQLQSSTSAVPAPSSLAPQSSASILSEPNSQLSALSTPEAPLKMPPKAAPSRPQVTSVTKTSDMGNTAVLSPQKLAVGSDKTAKKAPSTGRKAVVEGGLKHHANLNADFTFQSFVEGKSNQLGLAAAQQVAENPGRAYNPLYIYGGVGLGKTHLMHAVGNALREKNANAKIVYLHSERFVADMVKALQLNAINDFKRYYRSVDALLIDDIQFFSGKERSQEEFFHTFNALLEGGQQVILTGDRYPREMQNVEERLKSRFSWGLTVAVEPPELETRVAILMKKAEMENIHLPDDAAFFIAHRVRSNVRELEGTLKRVIANARFVNRPIDIGLVRDALKDLLALQDKLVGIDNIQRVVAEYYKIKVADLHSKRRTRQIARPRQIAMSLAKELTSQSLPEIGNAFGGRDHTTVLHACRKVRELERDDVDIREDIKNLMRLLTD